MFLKDTSGPVTAGVAPCHPFPFQGIQVIFGNDAAGQKVQPDTIVTDRPIID